MNSSPAIYSLKGLPSLYMSQFVGLDFSVEGTYTPPAIGSVDVVTGIDVSFSDTAIDGSAHYIHYGSGEMHFGAFVIGIPPDPFYTAEWRGEMPLPPGYEFRVRASCTGPASITLTTFGYRVPSESIISY